MKILLIADPLIPVPPKHYGGTERIVALYAEEFSRLGHEVNLMAAQGSKSFGGKLYCHRAPNHQYLSRAYRKLRFQLQSTLAFHRCDVVYNFGRIDYLKTLFSLGAPVLHCFQNPARQEDVNTFESQQSSNVALHFISNNQRASVKSSLKSYVISNCLNTRSIQSGAGQGGYLAFLGRLTRNKGVDVAISTAKATGKRLVIAGTVSSEEEGEKFFQEEVKPNLDGEQIVWIGPVDDQEKYKLLSNASALLFPIRWDEPFGIVMAEALACGTPVIATKRGSTPDVIRHGENGLLCNSIEPTVEEFSDAVSRLDLIDRKDCRRAAEDYFDVRVVAPQVLGALQRLASRGSTKNG
ncbi:glycosyltransferase family 4 protein [Synechococcus sp. ATX 2A4]|uniref:glycosyltransferase family 4 protein n=1 Tax=Synechococcus sp. ATX 2A4 TaxID=2823727 RepID=UPI0020CBBFA0|nr:glycosyltransferase family 4 protein [Synechococcus sp. ATX 2A4]MCP9884169.1 glycosyltransferase family 4 protein [Synechococcus sp. ATX 2A4]